MIGPQKINGYKYSAGVAYIAIPVDVERAVYIRDCYINWQVSITTEDGGFINRIPIAPEVMNWIEFPLRPEERGTPVVYVVNEMMQQEMVVATLPAKSNLGDLKEHSFKVGRKFQDQLVEISGNPQQGVLSITIDGASQTGQMLVHLFNKSQDCILKVDVGGSIQIASTGNIDAISEGTTTITTQDADSNDASEFIQTKTQHQFNSQKVVINKGNDPLVLGNELKSVLTDFIMEVSNITTIVQGAPTPITNKAQVAEYVNRLESILSKVIYVDK